MTLQEKVVVDAHSLSRRNSVWTVGIVGYTQKGGCFNGKTGFHHPTQHSVSYTTGLKNVLAASHGVLDGYVSHFQDFQL